MGCTKSKVRVASTPTTDTESKELGVSQAVDSPLYVKKKGLSSALEKSKGKSVDAIHKQKRKFRLTKSYLTLD